MTIDDLTDQIRTEAAHIAQTADASDDRFRVQVAIALASRVPVVLSSAIYSALAAGGTPPGSAHDSLSLGAGICGHHVALGAAVLDGLAVPHRVVQVFYTDPAFGPLNHTFLEVSWGDAWHLVDLTWGFIPHDGEVATALDYATARALDHRTGFHHSAIPWRMAVEEKYDLFGYLTDDPDGVYIGGEGSIRLEAVEGRSHPPHDRTTRAGRWSATGGAITGVVELRIAEGPWAITLEGEAASGVLRVGGSVSDVAGAGTVTVSVAGPTLVPIAFDTHGTFGTFTIRSVEGARRDAAPSEPVVEATFDETEA